MSGLSDFKTNDLAWSSFWGLLRGLAVETLIYPLDVIKIRQQCTVSKERSFEIAKSIFQQEGFGAFYKGLMPQLIKTSIKPIWSWPMITQMPSFFQRYQFENLAQHALTGLSIATFDAAVSTPLERAKILSALTGASKFSLKDVYEEGWKGFTIYWSKRSVNWITFLTCQKYFRDQSSGISGQPLAYPELTRIGIQVGLIVSLVSAPFDLANTLKQANLPITHLFSKGGLFNLYRGWPLNALSLVLHNIASVTLIEKLGK